jgi:SAM-dependent methyltransferase
MSRRQTWPPLTITAWLRFDAIKTALSAARPARVLEVGAGEGALGGWLVQQCDYTAIEPDAQSRAVAADRVGAARVLATLPDDSGYDLVCAFEVLEHIDDDAGALASWRKLLRPKGRLLLSVPAHADRFGPSDEYVGHFRRYDHDDLEKMLDATGFDVVQWSSYGAGLGQVIDAIRNRIVARRPKHSAATGSAESGRLFQPKSGIRVAMNYAAALPFRLAQRPFARTEIGIGYVVLAQDRA